MLNHVLSIRARECEDLVLILVLIVVHAKPGFKPNPVGAFSLLVFSLKYDTVVRELLQAVSSLSHSRMLL